VPNFVVNLSNNVVLHYNLDMSVLATKNWMKEIVKYGASDLCKINYKLSTGSKKILADKISQLYEMADILNIAYPGSIVKEEFFNGNEQEILNRMHVHFPTIHHDKALKDINYYASQYNVLIHSLEREFMPGAALRFRLFFDIHKSPKGYIEHPLDKEDYKRFEVFHDFGSLTLGYPHVGRHSNELFNARDLVCPKEQYVPQSLVSASCAMMFMFPAIKQDIKDKYLDQWKQYYIDRGGKDFFGCEIDDPEIRFGSIKIGQLCHASIDDRLININESIGMLKIKQKVLTNDVESFTIVE
jgi:hypothetical protein